MLLNFTTALALSVAGASDTPDEPAPIVPQTPEFSVVEHRGKRPILRVGGYGRSVLQLIDPSGHGVRRLVHFAERILGTASIADVTWVSTEGGVYRIGEGVDEPVLVMPGWVGRLEPGPDGMVGFLGSVPPHADSAATAHERGLARLAIIDARTGEAMVSTDLVANGSRDMAWIDGKLHGSCAGGLAFRLAGQSGPIQWKHVALDPASGKVTTLDSYSGPRRSKDPAKPVPVPPSWGNSSSGSVGRVSVTQWRSTRPKFLRQEGRLDHVAGSLKGDVWSLRLESDGSVALVYLDPAESPRWRSPSRLGGARNAPFFPGLDERSRYPLELHLEHGSAQRQPRALVMDREKRQWELFPWTPSLGLGPALGTAAAAPGILGQPGAWAWHPASKRLAICDPEAGAIWVHSLVGEGEPKAFEIPARLRTLRNGAAAASIRHLAWSADGSRLLVHGNASFAEIDPGADEWSPVFQSTELHRTAFAVPGGWWITGVGGTWLAERDRGGEWTFEDIGVGDSIEGIAVAPDGAHIAGVDHYGHCFLFDTASGDIESRWMAARPTDGGGQVGHFFEGGRYFMHGTGLPGHVRVIDLKDRCVYLEWQIAFGDERIPDWLIWTPEGASLGSSTARRAFLRSRGTEGLLALGLAQSRPEEVVRKIRRLLQRAR